MMQEMPFVERLNLYRAVKYQVRHAYADCGCSLRELWEIVQRNDTRGQFWRTTCLDEYKARIYG